ncbi:MAG: hypothetical protein JW850_06900 [Thermoflexales bacterium]|nr:hypothetical protein [Thermoflexales bacterium]
MLERHVILSGTSGSGKTSFRERFLDGVDASKVFVLKVTDFHEMVAQLSNAALEHEPPAQVDIPKLRQIVITHFNGGELRSLCFDTGVDYDSLAGENRDDKARELIAYFERHKSVAELVKIVHRLRPNAAWQATIPSQLLDECRSVSSTISSGMDLLERHIQQVLRSGASTLFRLMCLEKKRLFTEIYCELSEIRQKRLLRYVYDYVEAGDRQKWLDDGLVNRDLPSVGELRVRGLEGQDALIRFALDVLSLDRDTSLPRLASDPSRLLNDFREILGWFGFEKSVVLYDSLDGFRESSGDISRLLVPLLNARTLFDNLENIHFKFFLPVGLGDALAGCWAIQAGSIQWLPELSWQTTQLEELYRLRLKVASGDKYDSLTPIAEPSFSDLDDRLVRAVSTPRELVRLGRLLLDEHVHNWGDSDHLLSEQDFRGALGRFTRLRLSPPV